MGQRAGMSSEQIRWQDVLLRATVSEKVAPKFSRQGVHADTRGGNPGRGRCRLWRRGDNHRPAVELLMEDNGVTLRRQYICGRVRNVATSEQKGKVDPHP
jgi:hypothetical protein